MVSLLYQGIPDEWKRSPAICIVYSEINTNPPLFQRYLFRTASNHENERIDIFLITPEMTTTSRKSI